jgi:ABC-type transport system substrate-binding protein
MIGVSACKTENKRGNTVTIRLAGEPERLNPVTTEESNATQIMSHIFMPLLDFDPKTLELTPILAKNRPLVVNIDTGAFQGKLGYVYEIRDEATWDNGKPITSSDYIFTIKTILNKKVGASDKSKKVYNRGKQTLHFVGSSKWKRPHFARIRV